MRGRLAAALAVVGVGAAVVAPAAQARDGYVTSFDGTRIVYSFFPATGLRSGDRAPTVMMGPGYSSGRAGEGDRTVTALRTAGYDVLTWDPRGFGDSGGNVEVDSPEFEVRDVQVLIDLIAKQPEAQLDGTGDPRLGMIGGSYGGGIQNNTAALDGRVDAITPNIAWHSLITSLDKNDTAKGGWGTILTGLGGANSITMGAVGGATGQPAGFQLGRNQDPKIYDAFANGLTTGQFTAADKAFFSSRGPEDLIKRVKVPTLITQGTVDTLFTLREGIENYTAQRDAGATVSMIWFCGGHGVCNTSAGPDPDIVLHASLRWLDRYLRGDTRVDTGPRFQWVSDTGVLHGADDYPTGRGAPLTGAGSGTLPLVAGDTSGALIAAERAANAVEVPLAKPASATQLLGEPTLTMTYSGTSARTDGRLYAQFVDDKSGRVLGNQVTPVPVTLDGQQHTLTLPLEAVAIDAPAGASYRLQITDGSNVYFAARTAGVVQLTKVGVSIPTVGPNGSRVVTLPTGAAAGSSGTAGSAGAGASGSGTGRAVCPRSRRLAFTLHPVARGRIVRARAFLDRRLVRTFRARRGGVLRRIVVRGLPTRGRHTLRIDTFTRAGLARRTVRSLGGCARKGAPHGVRRRYGRRH